MRSFKGFCINNRRIKSLLFSRGLFLSLAATILLPFPVSAETTWVEIDEVVYGARPDERGPIGGGEGYRDIITSGDYTVVNAEALLDALSNAKEGETIFIPGETEIDLTTLIYIDRIVLEVPAGVTLAGNRGFEGSKGALLVSDTLRTPVMIRAEGPGVRVTGLRIQGPNPKRRMDHHRRSFGPDGGGHEYYYKFPVQVGISTAHDSLRVDNCDISGFGHAGIFLRGGEYHHVHHNFIHHCQYHGLGYGVVLDVAAALIEYNLFDSNRHSIAGTGKSGCSYIARHNVELGIASSHCFDMHGGSDRGDGTRIAGTWIEIYNNTFRAPQTPVVIRGIPEIKCEVYNNWFPRHSSPGEAVQAWSNTTVYDNAYGLEPDEAF